MRWACARRMSRFNEHLRARKMRMIGRRIQRNLVWAARIFRSLAAEVTHRGPLLWATSSCFAWVT